MTTFFSFNIYFLFIYLAALGLSCSMWDLVPQSGVEPVPTALGVWSLSHWAQESPILFFFIKIFSLLTLNIILFFVFILIFPAKLSRGNTKKIYGFSAA